ncbi:DUF262 domain-containing protein [Streptomyces sp. NPDC093970]|uniref:DUF262 domain-containing protein n=1 Tax=Streptomyces sp. NPDC093970 TaxID=3155076 RepID=UPI0034449197
MSLADNGIDNWYDEAEEEDLRTVVAKYLPRTVVWTTDWTTGALMDQIQREIFDVDPPFQRRSAWTDRKASLYIESLLLGCPVPPITLAELPPEMETEFQYAVIDGKQRLGAIKKFAVEQKLALTGLETLPHLNKLKYSDVREIPEFSRFENLPIRTVVMRNWGRSEVLQFVFHRLNTQVTPLSTHELRRSLYAGKFTNYLDARSGTSKGLRRILRRADADPRLRDAELLLRAVAFSCFIGSYNGNLKTFLDRTTESLNKSWNPAVQKQLATLADDIDAAISATYEIFEESAFQRLEAGDATGRFNRTIFDMMVLSLRFSDVRQAAIENSAAVYEAFERMNADPEKSRWLQATTKTKEAVRGRVTEWGKSLSVALAIPDLDQRFMQAAVKGVKLQALGV